MTTRSRKNGDIRLHKALHGYSLYFAISPAPSLGQCDTNAFSVSASRPHPVSAPAGGGSRDVDTDDVIIAAVRRMACTSRFIVVAVDVQDGKNTRVSTERHRRRRECVRFRPK